MKNNPQKIFQINISLFIVFIFIFLVGCNGKSMDENPTVAATFTKIIQPSSTQTPTFTPTSSPTITPSPTQTITHTPTPTPMGKAIGVLLGSVKWPSGTDGKILFLDLENGDFYQIGEDGYKLHDISPDGKRILYSVSTELFVMNFDGSGSYLLSNDFDNDSELGAFWSVDDQIIFIKKLGNKEGVFRINSDGLGQKLIFEESGILKLFRVKDGRGIFWIEGYLDDRGTNIGGYWWTDIKNIERINLQTKPVISVIVSNSGSNVVNILYPWDQFNVINMSNNFSPEIIGNYKAISGRIMVDKLFISSNESKILLQEKICNPRCDQFANYIISNTGELITELPKEIGEIWFFGSWSPDDGLFLYNQVLRENDGFHFMPTLLDLTTFELTKFPDYNTKDMVFEILWVPITK